MDKDLFERIIKQPSRYFPSVALFFVLDHTNQVSDLGFLLIAFCFAFYQDNIINHLTSLVNAKKVRKLIRKDENSALHQVLKDIFPMSKSSMVILGIMMILSVILNMYSLYKLYEFFVTDQTAKFLFVVGLLSLINGFAKYIKMFINNWQKLFFFKWVR